MEDALETFKNYIYASRDEYVRLGSRIYLNSIVISPTCTNTIDVILADTLLPNGFTEALVNWTPYRVSGDYRYYDNQDNSSWYKYVRLVKKKGQYSVDGHSQNYFVMFYTRLASDTALKFLNILFAINTPEMRITRFVKEYRACVPKMETIKCGIPITSQQKVFEGIMDYWRSPLFNTKVIISGPPGVGKGNIGRLLKRHLESYHPAFKHRTFVELFEDVDLSLPGLSITSQILLRASKKSPVIITVKNIDIYYNKVFENNSDPYQTSYTDNKTTFNNMLDDIGNTKHVICIFTTTLTKEQLSNMSSDCQAFFRRGRTDLFIRMTESDATIEEVSE